MKKKLIVSLLVLPMLLSCVSCGSSKSTAPGFSAGGDNPLDISYPAAAFVYRVAKPWQPAEHAEAITDALFQRPVSVQMDVATGPCYATGDPFHNSRAPLEVLYLHNGESPMYRSAYVGSKAYYTNLGALQTVTASILSNLPGYPYLLKLSGVSNLPFCPLEDALYTTEQALRKIGAPELTATYAVGFDAAALRQTEIDQLVLYFGPSILSFAEPTEFTEEDAAYLFTFQQMLDGYPIGLWHNPTHINDPLPPRGAPVHELDAQQCSVIYNETGIAHLEMCNLLEIGEPIDELAILPPEEAAKTVQEQCRAISPHAEIESAVFGFAIIAEKGVARILYPAYTFTVTEKNTDFAGDESSQIAVQRHWSYTVNAANGALLDFDASIAY